MSENRDGLVEGADHRADVYWEDFENDSEYGVQRVYRASSFGSCDQYLVRCAIGQTPAPPPDTLLAKFDESAAMEAQIITRLMGLGWRVLRPAELRAQYGTVQPETGQLEVDLKVPGGVIRCHPDGIAKLYAVGMGENQKYDGPLGEVRVLEIKAMAEGSGDPLKKSPNYAWQISIEMAGTRLPGLFVTGWKRNGELTDEPLLVQYIDKAPFSRGDIVRRVKTLDEKIRKAEEGEGLDGCTRSQWPCGFWQDHDPDDPVHKKKDVPELEDVPASVKVAMAKAAALTSDSKKLADEAKAAREIVTTWMIESDLKAGKYEHEGFVVELVQKKGSRSFDWDRARADGVEIDDYIKIGRGSTYVTVGKA